MITGIVDTVVDFIGGIAGSLADTIVGDLVHAISTFLGTQLLLLSQLVMELVHAAYSLFSVFSGMAKINWNGEYTYLFNLFFQNSAINGIYWGMAMIGFVLLIGFTIVAVIRKMFDLGDQEQRSLGQILGSAFRSFLVIISLTAILTAGTTLTNLLIQQVGYVFDQGNTLTKENDMEFTDEQYATMARIFNTIGNYSLNPGYAQKYNLNACYNEIRPDLLYLQDQGVFDYFYPDVNASGDPDPTWQSELQKLILANDPNHALKMDPYYEGVSNALLEIITILQTDAEFYPVSNIKNHYLSVTEVPLDRVLFLSGTMSAANNELYNLEPGFDDSLRGAFYTGDKNIYNFFDVTEAFDISLGSINYLIILLGAYWVLKNLFRCLLNCTSRIVNIVGLYIVAPPLAASMPLDGGRRFREWTNSMVIQIIGIFGNIIPMRLVMLFLPIIMNSKLTLVDSTVINIIGKVLIVWGMLEAVGRFNGVLTGILANNGAGSAMRGIDSVNRTADTRFSRYGGKYMPGTTDVDDPSGRGKKAERMHEKEYAAQRSFQQQNAGSSGGGQAAGMAMKAAGMANPAVMAAMAAGKAIGGAGSGQGSGSGGGEGQDKAIKAAAMLATGGASAGMTAGGSGSNAAGGTPNAISQSGGQQGNENNAEPQEDNTMNHAPQDAEQQGAISHNAGKTEKPLAVMSDNEKDEAFRSVFGSSGGSGKTEEDSSSGEHAETKSQNIQTEQKAEPRTENGKPVSKADRSVPKRVIPPPRKTDKK